MISISVKALSWFDQENQFWEVVLALGNFGADTWYDLKILQQCGKGVKTKSQNVLGDSSYDLKCYRGKTGRGPFCSPPPILNRVKGSSHAKFKGCD